MQVAKDPADPRRCKGNARDGQCGNLAEPGSEYCAACGGRDHSREQDRRQYLLTKAEYRKRIAELSDHDDVKSLRDEIAIARMLIEERLNNIQDRNDLLASCGPLNQLLLTVERLVKSAHVLEQNLGLLLSKEAVLRLAHQLGDIVTDVLREEQIPDFELVADEIFHRFSLCAKGVRNEEPARAVKLLSNPAE
jgi:hypothetical protein